ncbi:hypothetical protein MLD38_021268 [Melastoma candidum]|uniref:Uncharacterized protein n=1 Tax=Melastoma candidum TaxID=119954 RepID=A0ACB9QG35_9MYRT|nr:hypothetical protein MLD38_021268 [Melastoma candidum]
MADSPSDYDSMSSQEYDDDSGGNREEADSPLQEFTNFEGFGGGGEGRSTPGTTRPRVRNGGNKAFPPPSEGEEVDGLLCPICYQGWSDGGDHSICCLPCGHVFGMSCIKRWLQQQKKSGKCPKCNASCTVKGIRKLYATQLTTVDEESLKRILNLEAQCAALLEKDIANEAKWSRAIDGCMNRLAEVETKLVALEEKTNNLEQLFKDTVGRPSGLTASCSTHNTQSSDWSCSQFKLQAEVQFDGSRLFDINLSSQIIMVARRLSGMGGIRDALTKASLVDLREAEDINLPSSTKAVKDLHVSLFNRNLVLYASLGKNLSILSLESNNVVLDYKLPVGAWSCSWDINSPHYIYTGLQNGMLMTFDVRQTQKPLVTRDGLTCNPIHTTCSVMQKRSSGVSTVLTASSIGLCEWTIGSAEERPTLVPESANFGVCISLAYCPGSDSMVASYRPKVEVSGEMPLSQISSQHSCLGGTVVRGQHLCLRRIGRSYLKLSSTDGDVSGIRLPRSVIMDLKNGKQVFGFGNEATSDLVLQEMSSLSMSGQIKLGKPPLRDIRSDGSNDDVLVGRRLTRLMFG